MLEQGYLGMAKEQTARGRMVATRLGGALSRRLRPLWQRLRNLSVGVGAGTPVHRSAAASGSLAAGATDASAASAGHALPPAIEDLLESYGYDWLAYEVRRRRRDAERYVAGRLH
jgi:hypothetical protein